MDPVAQASADEQWAKDGTGPVSMNVIGEFRSPPMYQHENFGLFTPQKTPCSSFGRRRRWDRSSTKFGETFSRRRRTSQSASQVRSSSPSQNSKNLTRILIKGCGAGFIGDPTALAPGRYMSIAAIHFCEQEPVIIFGGKQNRS